MYLNIMDRSLLIPEINSIKLKELLAKYIQDKDFLLMEKIIIEKMRSN